MKMGGKKKKEKLPPHAPRTDFGAFPRWKPEHGVVKKSMMSIQHAGKSTRSASNVTWGNAASCKLFRKKISPKDGKAIKTHPKTGAPLDERPNRAFGAHLFKAVASGAAGALGAEMKVQSELMRCKTDPEHDVYPALYQVMPGAAVQMEWCGIGYVQEIHGVAKRLKAETCGVRLRMRAVPPGGEDPWRTPLPLLRASPLFLWRGSPFGLRWPPGSRHKSRTA